MENITLVRKYLGGPKVIGTPKSELDFVDMIRTGFPFAVFELLRDQTQLTEETMFKSLGIAKRTAARRKGRTARLKPSESEGALRLAQALATASDVLGGKEKARAWLQTDNRALGGRAPITLLDTGLGFQQVIDVLSRVEHGIHS